MTIHQQIAGGGGCFKGDTLIQTPNGETRIDAIKQGDHVYCFDDKGEIFSSEVVAVHFHEAESVTRYTFWGGGYLDATPNHWVLNQYNAFVCIGSLGLDDCLVDENNHLRPIVKKEELGLYDVYNLTVKGYHTFIAGGIRVHNAGLGAGKIIGAGGGGKGGGGSPDTANDNLDSKATAYVLDLISEGEIEGFPSAKDYERGSQIYEKAALKDIYFDKTPILRPKADPANLADNDYNYRKSKADIRYGTINQTYIPEFDDVLTETIVNRNVLKRYPVVRTVTDVNADRVRVTLNFPALQEFEDDGDITGTKVRYKISVAGFAQAYSVVVDKTIEGRSGDLYQKKHEFSIAGLPFPVSVKVTRVTDDPDDVKIQNQFEWYSITEIISAKLTYPTSALVGLVLDSREFSSVPQRSYRIRGIKVKLPSNASVNKTNGRVTYSGVWDGTFGAKQWCCDPAWCLWDLLTNCRYGFGQHIKTKDLDKFAFYQASQYCNELVPDYTGKGTEPRFSCNVVIQNQTEAYKLINDMCAVFRAMPYWSTGSLSIGQDRPTEPTYLFNQTNVTEEGFQYSGSSLKTRHTVAIVSYLDLESQEIAYEAVEDAEGIAKYGVVPVQIEGFATTSQGQAHRLGEWLLYTEQNESEVCTFKTTLGAGAEVRPGNVIGIIDPVRSGVRRGGRVVAATTTRVRVDEAAATNLPTTGSPKLMVTLSDGTVQERNVLSVSGEYITVSSPFTTTPLVGGAFIYNNSTQAATYWRVLSIKEEQPTVYAITALTYNKSKYDYIERNLPLEQKTFVPLSVPRIDPPPAITTQSTTVSQNGQTENKTYVSWSSQSDAIEYVVSYRRVPQ